MYMQMIQVSARVSDLLHAVSGLQQLQARYGVEQVNSHVHLPVSSACTLYVAPEDGFVLHPKHVEQKVQ